ncbi:hypothetical protein [Nostoc sp.]|uniref:hypothetical protein n=1 Tax=Nostoc sp. TaxID=1180 RepID=UPI002FF8D4B8
MEQHRFGSTQREVAAIGQGTWYIDNGDRAEVVVAEATTTSARSGFPGFQVLPGNASRRGTIVACEKSLARLHTDRLDSYLLHWRGQYPLEEKTSELFA